MSKSVRKRHRAYTIEIEFRARIQNRKRGFEKYCYVAWCFDDGVARGGVEEEILARSEAEAIRIAWRRAIHYLKPKMGQDMIRLDSVTLIQETGSK